MISNYNNNNNMKCKYRATCVAIRAGVPLLCRYDTIVTGSEIQIHKNIKEYLAKKSERTEANLDDP